MVVQRPAQEGVAVAVIPGSRISRSGGNVRTRVGLHLLLGRPSEGSTGIHESCRGPDERGGQRPAASTYHDALRQDQDGGQALEDVSSKGSSYGSGDQPRTVKREGCAC